MQIESPRSGQTHDSITGADGTKGLKTRGTAKGAAREVGRCARRKCSVSFSAYGYAHPCIPSTLSAPPTRELFWSYGHSDMDRGFGSFGGC
jgi:hypothetical protein